jgi:hypothetical protein
MSQPLSPPFDRRVRHLRVRAASEDDARRAAILIEDALRTASAPVAAGGQMLVVRRLSLRGISVRASAATLALQIERALREARMAAVPFDLPAARTADAVLVAGSAEGLARLAKLHAAGAELREWFWTAVVPAWRADLSRSERWLALLEAAHELPQAALAAAMIVEQAVCAGMENELLCAVPPGRGCAWLQLAGWTAAEVHEIGTCELTLHAQHEAIVRRWARRWGPASERLIWMAVMFAVAEKPARVADPDLPRRAAAWMAARLEGAPSRPLESDPALREPDTFEAAGMPVDTDESSPAEIEPARSKTSRSEPADLLEARHLPDERTETASMEIACDKSPLEPASMPKPGAASEFTGLLFLAPIFARLGFAEALAAQPALIEIGFPARLLRFIGGRVGLSDRDPLALALDEFDPDATLPVTWQMPAPAAELLAVPAPRTHLDSPLLAWLTAARRWSRRRAHMGLVSLIRRPGTIAASRAHLDITFDLDRADLRLRRLALDVDPGWVPWLGRVVHFHYLEGHE